MRFKARIFVKIKLSYFVKQISLMKYDGFVSVCIVHIKRSIQT